MRRYAINSLHNMRDLGGYPTTDGRMTQFGCIFRSDCPITIDDKDQHQLESLDIQTVIDLRTAAETERMPSRFKSLANVAYHNVSFITGNESPDVEAAIPSIYLRMMEDRMAIPIILQRIAEAEGPVLFHCAVGKDRTGIVSALLLKICGVPHQDILADYQVSHTYLKELIGSFRVKNPDFPVWAGQSKPEYLEDAWRGLMDRHGTFESYLNAMEIPNDVIETIRSKLLE